jgi:predicted DNA-binding transcriptional regulator AlpA
MPKVKTPAKTRPSPLPPGVLRLRTVAELIDTPADTIRDRVERGTWPRPISIVDRDWYYPAAWINEWVKTGEWPAEAVFRGRERG